MSRKSWSNLFLLTAVLFLFAAAAYHFPMRFVAGLLAPAFLLLAMQARKRMV